MNASRRMELEVEEALTLVLASGTGIEKLSRRTGIAAEDILAASKGDIRLQVSEDTLSILRQMADSSYQTICASEEGDDITIAKAFESMFGPRKKFA